MRDPEGELARRKDEGEPLGGYARAVHNILRDVGDGRRLREALDLIWHVAPLPTQSEHQRLERIHEIARRALFPPNDKKEMGAMNDEDMRKFLVEWLNKRGVVFARPEARPGAGDDTTLVMGAFNLDALATDLVRWVRLQVLD